MTNIGMNLLEYTSTELFALQIAVQYRLMTLEAQPQFYQRELEVMLQWEVKIFEAKQEVLRKEKVQSN